MDARVWQQKMEENSSRKSASRDDGSYFSTISGKHHSIPPSILFIGREQNGRIYTDDVLRRAGFGVRAVAPWEAKGMVSDGDYAWPLVVFSNTLNSQDISEIGGQLRKHSPQSRLLLMLGPASIPVNSNLFDATLESLEGPVALIRIVRRLAEAVTADGIPA